jgi:hypothetical protein
MIKFKIFIFFAVLFIVFQAHTENEDGQNEKSTEISADEPQKQEAKSVKKESKPQKQETKSVKKESKPQKQEAKSVKKESKPQKQEAKSVKKEAEVQEQEENTADEAEVLLSKTIERPERNGVITVWFAIFFNVLLTTFLFIVKGGKIKKLAERLKLIDEKIKRNGDNLNSLKIDAIEQSKSIKAIRSIEHAPSTLGNKDEFARVERVEKKIDALEKELGSFFNSIPDEKVKKKHGNNVIDTIENICDLCTNASSRQHLKSFVEQKRELVDNKAFERSSGSGFSEKTESGERFEKLINYITSNAGDKGGKNNQQDKAVSEVIFNGEEEKTDFIKMLLSVVNTEIDDEKNINQGKILDEFSAILKSIGGFSALSFKENEPFNPNFMRIAGEEDSKYVSKRDVVKTVRVGLKSEAGEILKKAEVIIAG